MNIIIILSNARESHLNIIIFNSICNNKLFIRSDPHSSLASLLRKIIFSFFDFPLFSHKVSEETIPALENKVKAAGAPWIEGQGLIDN